MSTQAAGTGCLNCVLLDSLAQSGAGDPDAERSGVESSPAEPTAAASNLHRFQHYEILKREDGTLWELGRGAMGITFKALDVNLRVPVALKVINGRYSRQTLARERFLNEARAAACLRHPNVASVFHFGTITRTPSEPGAAGVEANSEDAGECFYTMEFVEGETLEERMRRTGPFGIEPTLKIALQISRALGAAEKRGLVHRDLKPANIMLAAEGETASDNGIAPRRQSELSEAWVKVIDFGLAKAVSASATGDLAQTHPPTAPLTLGGFRGTPQFASPEQFERRQVDARSDIFALGTVIWYLLTGNLPFQGRTLAEIQERQRNQLPLEQLAKAAVPRPVVALLTSMLAVNPADRPISAAVLHERLEVCLADLPASRLSGKGRPPARRPRFRLLAVTAILTFLGLLVAAGVFYRRRISGRPTAAATSRTIPLASRTPALYVTNYKNNSIGVYDAVTGEPINPAFITGLSGPNGIRVSGTNLYVANETDGTIGLYNAQTGAVINPGFITGLKAATGLALAGGNLYVTDDGTLLVDEFNAATGAPIKVPLIGGLGDPDSIIVSGNTLYLQDTKGGMVSTYDATTGTPISAKFITGLRESQGIALAANMLYVCERGPGDMQTFDATTGASINASFLTGLTGPNDVAIYGGILYVGNYVADSIDTYDAKTGKRLKAGFITGLHGPNFQIVVPPLPSVHVAATVPQVAVGSGQAGEFTLSLSAPQDHDLFVSYTFRGTAVSGRDYMFTKTTVKIEAGQTSKAIAITPLENAPKGSTRSVDMLLLPRDGYTVDEGDHAEVKIIAR